MKTASARRSATSAWPSSISKPTLRKPSLVPDAKFERQYFGIAVAKGNDELRNKINAGLKKIVADGTYAKIYQTWFDSNVPTLPAE